MHSLLARDGTKRWKRANPGKPYCTEPTETASSVGAVPSRPGEERSSLPGPLGQVFGGAEQSRTQKPQGAEQADEEPDSAGGLDEVRVGDGDQADEDEDHRERSERDQD